MKLNPKALITVSIVTAIVIVMALLRPYHKNGKSSASARSEGSRIEQFHRPPQPEPRLLIGCVTNVVGSDNLKELEEPEPLIYPLPNYPDCVRKGMMQGVVRVEAVISADGKVEDVQLIESLHPILDIWAVGSVKGWTFAPAKQNHRPVRVTVPIEVPFLPHGPGAPCSWLFSQS